MGEAPILLVHAAYPEIDPNQRMCYLIRDAHHSIPFQETGPAKYVAPSWFDAVMDTSGPNPDNPNSLPDEFYIWMARGALKYTFTAHYEDMYRVELTNGCLSNDSSCIPETCFAYGTSPLNFDHCLVSAHDAFDAVAGGPTNGGGYGLPYYATLTKIEDRLGNRVEIAYVAQSQWYEPDGWGASPPLDPNGLPLDPNGLLCQNCNEKGQIASVKLYAAGAQSAQWTLVYRRYIFLASTGAGSVV